MHDLYLYTNRDPMIKWIAVLTNPDAPYIGYVLLEYESFDTSLVSVLCLNLQTNQSAILQSIQELAVLKNSLLSSNPILPDYSGPYQVNQR